MSGPGSICLQKELRFRAARHLFAPPPASLDEYLDQEEPGLVTACSIAMLRVHLGGPKWAEMCMWHGPVEPEPARTGVGKVRGRLFFSRVSLRGKWRKTMRPFLIAAASMAFGSAALAADKPLLTVYTYDSFVSDWGPGPAVEAAFEETCGCDLQLLAAGDGASILSRLKLEGARSKADLVLGLDTNLTAQAVADGLIVPHGVDASFDLPIAWDDAHFLPYDWGYFAFVYDNTKMTDVPQSLEALAASDLSVVIQDPRTSTPGLGLLLWADAALGDKAPQFWEDMSGQIVTVTKGWSEAYGMFLEGEADMVLSYTTSPAYHIVAEEDNSKSAAVFDDGHYMQVEVAGITATSTQQDLATTFLEFMVSDAFQSIIPTTNWMYPVVAPSEPLPDAFARPAAKALLLPAEEAAARRDAALATWLDALAK